MVPQQQVVKPKQQVDMPIQQSRLNRKSKAQNQMQLKLEGQALAKQRLIADETNYLILLEEEVEHESKGEANCVVVGKEVINLRMN